MHYLFSLLIFLTTGLALRAQDVPECDASVLSLTSLEVDSFGWIANLRFSEQDNVESYDLLHEFTLAGDEMSEILSFAGPEGSVALNGESTHLFTALNRCSDGNTHTGSTLSLDFSQNQSSASCPVPTNLVIEVLDPGFILFSWDPTTEVDFWQVRYEPEGLPAQDFMVADPLVEQVLEQTVLHTFSLYAVCDDEMLNSTVVPTFSPTVIFSVVIVEDLKLLPVSCDSLTQISWDSYLMECTQHGDFGPNKEDFVFTHNCADCTLSTSIGPVEEAVNSRRIYPNPATSRISLDYRLEESGLISYRIHDLAGQLVRVYPTVTAPANIRFTKTLSLEGLSPGIYWLITRVGASREVEKIIVR